MSTECCPECGFEEGAQCSELVLHGYSRYPCSRKTTIERDGKRWCWQHDPLKVAERDKERRARWKADDDVFRERGRRRGAEIKACEGIPTELLEKMLFIKTLDRK